MALSDHCALLNSNFTLPVLRFAFASVFLVRLPVCVTASAFVRVYVFERVCLLLVLVFIVVLQ